jgi:hypothetical protein
MVREKEETLAEPGQLTVLHTDRAKRRSLPSALRYVFIALGGAALAALVFSLLIQIGV